MVGCNTSCLGFKRRGFAGLLGGLARLLVAGPAWKRELNESTVGYLKPMKNVNAPRAELALAAAVARGQAAHTEARGGVGRRVDGAGAVITRKVCMFFFFFFCVMPPSLTATSKKNLTRRWELPLHPIFSDTKITKKKQHVSIN